MPFFVFFRACNFDATKIVQYLEEILAESCKSDKRDVNIEMMRALIAIEELLRTDLIHPDIYDNLLSEELKTVMASKKNNLPEITIKCKKILLIIQGLKKYTEE